MAHPTARRPSPARTRTGPPATTLLVRGLRRRCPRCGERHVFDGWFRFVASCPRCGLHFQDDDGFFLGAYLVNLTLVFTAVFLALIGMVVQLGVDPDANPVPVAGAGVLAAVALPVIAYPFACTTWVALLLMGGREPTEPARGPQPAPATPTGQERPVPPRPQ